MMTKFQEMGHELVIEAMWPFDLNRIADKNTWNGMDKEEMHNWLIDKKIAVENLVTGLVNCGYLTYDDSEAFLKEVLESYKSAYALLKQI